MTFPYPARFAFTKASSGLRVGNGDIDEQTLRLDFLYTMPEYDLSMGTGSLDINVEFNFYRER